jgi:4-hydroxy-2-oxoheptanedioate aldolase
MRINSARKKLLEGGIISGPSLLYASPEIAEEAAQYGFDFVVIDWQHGAWSEATINSALACFVNVDSVHWSEFDPRPYLRAGCWILVPSTSPMVETPEQCAAIVRRCSAQGGRARPPACARPTMPITIISEYVEGANDQILTIIMVETLWVRFTVR